MENLWQYLIVILILIIVGVSIVKSKQKDFKFEANKLIGFLGGKENILESSFNKSRFIVTLKDVDLVNKEGIQKMGAQGIVEIDNQLKIILGNDSLKIEKYINDII